METIWPFKEEFADRLRGQESTLSWKQSESFNFKISLKDNLKIFSERLKELRQEKELTAEELAKIIGVSEPTISRWENRLRIPNFLHIIALADFFGVSQDYLTGAGPLQATLQQKLVE